MAYAHRVVPIAPTAAAIHRSLGGMTQAARNWIIDNFINTWGFTPPLFTSQPIANQHQYGLGTWVPAPQSHSAIPLAQGGSGVVHVWVCLDHNGNIVDRVVVKNNFSGWTKFQDGTNWTNGVVAGEPIESSIANRIHARLEANNPGDGRYVAECLGWGGIAGNPPALPVLPQFKLYYEYMVGDLLHAIVDQRAGTRLVKRPGRLNRRRVTQPDKPFPEGFLWMLFEALAKMAVAMDQEQIYHGDLYSANVFLGHPDQNADFAIWPIPKISDFGSSRDLNDPLVRSRMRRGNWQHNFAAPEMDRIANNFVVNQFQFLNHNHVPPMPTVALAEFSCKTNIYQIGLMMLSALRIESVLEETGWRGPHGTTLPVNQQFGFAAPHTSNPIRMRLQGPEMADYSVHLFRLVKACIRFAPQNRITPTALLAEVQRHMANRDGGMRAAKGRFAWNHPQAIRTSVADKYKVGKKPYRPPRVE